MQPGLQRQFSLVLKMFVLFALGLLLGVPLLMIHGAMVERKGYHQRVVRDIAESTAGEQTVAGPVLLVHFRERVRERSAGGDSVPAVAKDRVYRRDRVIVPDSLVIRCDASVEERYRGIYKAHVVHSRDTLVARFRVPPRYGLAGSRDILDFEPARLVVEVSDVRGLRRVPVIIRDGQALEVTPGSEFSGERQGFSADAGDFSPAGGTFEVSVVLELTGTERLSFIPVGKDTRVEARSSWPHPSFKGAFLPETRAVGPQGFRATWQVSHFATNVERAAERCADGECDALTATSFGVDFIQPVDIYQQSERAVKYGMLFIGLTFVAFFMFEVLRRLRVHPVQYGLVGFALALFFLLVFSLSEHLPFGLAYLAASAACVGLLAFYVGHVLGRLSRGVGFGAMLGCLYAILYVLLQSEDYALLLGSLLLFAVLAFVMVMTRRVDWYGLSGPPPEANG